MRETHFYDLLGVTPTATEQELRKAYYKMAKKFHPDKNPTNGERFAEISYAYGILSDKRDRKIYDLRGAAYFKESRGGFFKAKEWVTSIAATFFKPKKPSPVLELLSVTLNILYSGGSIKVDKKCNRIACLTCSTNCACNGRGFIEPIKQVEVIIEKGMRNGSEIRIDGDKYDLPADVIFSLFEESHRVFEHIVGDDISTTISITPEEATNGFQRELITLDGRPLTIKRKPGVTFDGTEDVFHYEGLPLEKYPDRRGDLIVKFKLSN